ncbi:MAG: cadherin repeat domain-containing protein [Fibrobacter sp.]|nr:cadherin repeat domain-containing protein [Fibrobacter sp.]
MNIRVIALLLAGMIPAFAADESEHKLAMYGGDEVDPAPLHFDNFGESEQSGAWTRLLKYKLWGTSFFETGTVEVEDSVGWTGCAKCKWQNTNAGLVLGGPISFNGDVSLGNETTFLTGPTRIEGDFTTGNANNGKIYGTVCVKGSVNGEAQKLIEATKNSDNPGILFYGNNAHGGECSDELVLPVDDKLKVPSIDWTKVNTRGTLRVENGGTYLDATGGNPSEELTLYFDEIAFENDSKLYIVMPEGGRLTRIFTRHVTFKTHPLIQVVYGTKEHNTEVLNEDYAGNLLFYVDDDILLENTDNVIFQGSFLSTGRLTYTSNGKFAGQLIANELKLGNQINGKNFRFVPYNPPKILLESKARIEEGRTDPQDILVTLNRTASTNVTFNYCFEFKNKNEKIDGFDAASEARLDLNKMPLPICNGQSVSKSAMISNGKDNTESSIAAIVVDDNIRQNDEAFILKIWNLTGAVIGTSANKGDFKVIIEDNDSKPVNKDTTVTGYEDTDLLIDRFPVYMGDQSINNTYEVKIVTLPEKGRLTLSGKDVKVDDVISSNTLKNLVFRGAPDSSGSPYTSFKYIAIVDGEITDAASTVTINLLPENDPPVAKNNEPTIYFYEISHKLSDKSESFEIVDPDDNEFTYEFDNTDANYKKVSDLFAIDSKTGVVSVKEKAVLDYESADSVFTIKVKITDAGGKTDSDRKSITPKLTIKILDENEKPTIEDASAVVAERTPNGTEVVRMIASDPDIYNVEFSKLTYEIITKDVPFTMDSNKILVADGSRLVYKTQPKWEFEVRVIDGKGLSDTATVVITVTEQDFPPHIFCVTGDDDCNGPFYVDENSETGFVIHEFGVSDEKYLNDLKVTLEDVDKTGADSLFNAVLGPVSNNSARSLKIVVKDKNKLDYEKIIDTHKVRIVVTNPKGLNAAIERTIVVNDVNETPDIEDQFFTVNETALVGTSVGFVVATDPDKNPEFNKLTFSKVEGSGWFNVLESGEIKLLKELDYKKDSVHVMKVRVTDGTNSNTANVTIKVLKERKISIVDIIEADNADSTWFYPEIIYTHTPTLHYTWRECVKDTLHCVQKEGDTTLVTGVNKIVKTFQDPTTDEMGYDEVTVYYSDETPIVEISTNKKTVVAKNIYSIVEKVDANDKNVYVNHTENDVTVKIVDNAMNTDTSFVVKIDLGKKIDVPTTTLNAMNAVVKEGVALNDAPGKVTRTPVNGNGTKVSYNDKVGGVDVTISYMVDENGEVQKQDVIGEKGKKISTEVITVSYETEINGKKVTVSYEADGFTGAPIYVDADGHKTFNSEKNGIYTVSYGADNDPSMQISYFIDKNGKIVANANGDKGYNVSYTYVNKFGNAAKQDIFVVLDMVGPEVKIVSPVDNASIFGNYTDVVWTVGGVEQDTLKVQSLKRGTNVIVRYFQDKAGNVTSDTVYVIMKNAKDVDINVEKPVTIVNRDSVEKYYEVNAPVDGERFAVSIYNTKTNKEIETQVGFRPGHVKKGSGEQPYEGLDGHLGPTLAIDVKLPMANAVGGLATLDDIVGEDGMVAIEGVDAANSEKMTVNEYAQAYCTDEFVKDMGSDLSKMNLFDTKMNVNISVFTNSGSFVDSYSFTQDLNDAEQVNDVGMLKMFFEQKPDKDGYVRTAKGVSYGTGAYVYKADVTMKSTLRCTLPPVKDVSNTQVKGAVRVTTDDLLKKFGYKRPEYKIKK